MENCIFEKENQISVCSGPLTWAAVHVAPGCPDFYGIELHFGGNVPESFSYIIDESKLGSFFHDLLIDRDLSPWYESLHPDMNGFDLGVDSSIPLSHFVMGRHADEWLATLHFNRLMLYPMNAGTYDCMKCNPLLEDKEKERLRMEISDCEHRLSRSLVSYRGGALDMLHALSLFHCIHQLYNQENKLNNKLNTKEK